MANPKTSKSFRILPIATLSLVVLAAGLLLAVQRVRAYGERQLLSLGDHMMRYAESENQTTPVELKINGASVFMSNGAVDADVFTVLDHFQAACARKNGKMGEQWTEIAAQRGRTLSEHTAMMEGVFRVDGEGRGIVACFETGDERLEPSDFIDRVHGFLSSGDLSEVGNMRYVRVTQGKERSVFVAFWTEGPLPLWQMFPESGDAPGVDPEGIDRPQHSRRLLSSEQVGRDVLVSMYSAPKQSQSELEAFYREQLKARGYTLGDRSGSNLLIAHDDGHMVTVALASDDAGHGVATLTTRPD